MIILLIRFLTT